MTEREQQLQNKRDAAAQILSTTKSKAEEAEALMTIIQAEYVLGLPS